MKFEEAAVVTAVALLLLSQILSDDTLILAALLVAVTWGAVRLWHRLSLRGVSVSASFAAPRVFCGEETELLLQVENRKLLPLPWLDIEADLPLTGLQLKKGRQETDISNSRSVFRLMLSLGWYQRVSRRYPVECRQRGLYRVGPVRVSGGDPFGFYTRRQEYSHYTELAVLPRVLPVRGIDFSCYHPFGEKGGRGWMFNDPTLQAGARDYRPGDPLSRVHWKASARTGTLQVRAGLPSYTASLVFCLDVTSFPPCWKGLNRKLLEQLITTTASLSAAADSGRRQLGLMANGYSRRYGRLIRITPSRNPGQLGVILTALASLQETASMPMADFLQVLPPFPWGTELVVITAFITEELTRRLLSLRDRGYPILLIKGGDREVPQRLQTAGIPVFYGGEEEQWHERKELALERI